MKITRKFLKRLAIIAACIVVVLLAGVEIAGRAMGLCDPPLLIEDADMEYRFRPDQACVFMGNHVNINEASMRSDPITPDTPDDFRVFIVGDSVAFGGTLVDQSDIAASRVQSALRTELKRPVLVMNASAGSWGPPNELAYVRRFGEFKADVAVVILSTQDSDDQMTFARVVGFNSSYPYAKPRSALWIILDRYGPRYFAIRDAQAVPATQPEKVIDPTVMQSITDLVTLLRTDNRPVIVVMHAQRDEVAITEDNPAQIAIREAALKGGATVVDTRPAYRAAQAKGINLFRDTIHPTAEGQHVLGDVILDAIRDTTKARP